MADNSAFRANFAKLLAKAGDKSHEVVRQSMLSIGEAVDTRAPVDQGRFRANTNGAVGSMDTRTDYPPDKSGSAAQGRLKVAVASWKPGQTIYLTSSLPYARVLEYGRADGSPGSKQAPNGIFRLSVQEFSTIIQKAADKIK